MMTVTFQHINGDVWHTEEYAHLGDVPAAFFIKDQLLVDDEGQTRRIHKTIVDLRTRDVTVVAWTDS